MPKRKLDVDYRARLAAENRADRLEEKLDQVMAAAAAAAAPPPAAAPAAAPAPQPPKPAVEVLREEYKILRSQNPYHAAEFLLNHPEIAHSRFSDGV